LQPKDLNILFRQKKQELTNIWLILLIINIWGGLMLYRTLGQTGIKLSVLGYGTKYLPESESKGKRWISIDNSIKAMHRSFELGVNHIDTSYLYNNGLSETAISQVLKNWQEKIYIGTKAPTKLIKKPGDYRKYLEEQLSRLNVDCIDFYYFDQVDYQNFLLINKRTNWIKEAKKAQKEGLIKHIGFSFNAPPEEMKLMVDMKLFSVISCSYNLLNRKNSIAIEYAASKGTGIIAAEPLAGGKIVLLPNKFRAEMNPSARNNVELGLSFVIANRCISATLCSMKNLEMVEENIFYTADSTPITKEQLKNMNDYLDELQEAADKICKGCKYCLSCPQEVNIPYIFELYIDHQIYGLKDYASQMYSNLETNSEFTGKNALSCFNCGLCSQKCPLNIEISIKLKEAHKTLSPYYQEIKKTELKTKRKRK
jgi:hypothetical protein